jgi:oligoribonuclease
MSEVNDLLWVDLETTGSDETRGDEILEIACIVTDKDLNEVKGEWQSLVRPSLIGQKRLVENDFVRKMHMENGLLAELTGETPDISGVDYRLAEWLDKNFHRSLPIKKFTLAGSGVAHFDSRFIRGYMPRLSAQLNYFTIDVGVIRRSWREWVGTEVSNANEGKTHRAMDDIRCHLEEARAFQKYWQDLEEHRRRDTARRREMDFLASQQ